MFSHFWFCSEYTSIPVPGHCLPFSFNRDKAHIMMCFSRNTILDKGIFGTDANTYAGLWCSLR